MKTELNNTNPLWQVMSDTEEDLFSTNNQIGVESISNSLKIDSLTTSRETKPLPLLSHRYINPQIPASNLNHLEATISCNAGYSHLISDQVDIDFTSETVNLKSVKKPYKRKVSTEGKAVKSKLMKKSYECKISRKGAKDKSSKIITLKEKRWNLFVDELRKLSISEASIERISSVRNKVKHIEEIIFLVSASAVTPGHGDLNLCVEFLKNFTKIASEKFKLIRFICSTDLNFKERIAPLIAGISPIEEYPCEAEKLLDHGRRTIISDHKRSERRKNTINLSLPDNRYANGHIFGITYVYVPTDLCDDILEKPNQLYIATNPFDVRSLVLKFRPLIITNYAFFPLLFPRALIKNTNNHLPTYPYEMCNETNQPLLRMNIGSSFFELPVIPNVSYNQCIFPAVDFFMRIFTMAKQNAICLTLFYNSRGVKASQFKMYGQAIEKCFPNKPIIIIRVENEKNSWCKPTSNIEFEQLKNEGVISFFDFMDLKNLTEKGIKHIKKIAVIKCQVLPKLIMNMLCFYSNIPMYAPGASTANLAECFRKPYLHSTLDIDYKDRVDRSVLDSWIFINKLFSDFNLIEFEMAKEFCSTLSQDECLKAYHYNESLINNSEILLKINGKHIYQLKNFELFYVFANSHMYYISNNRFECKNYKLSRVGYPNYFKSILEKNILIEFCEYVCDEINKLMIYYIKESTIEGGIFHELAKELQQQALHPDNNMMFNLLDDHM